MYTYMQPLTSLNHLIIYVAVGQNFFKVHRIKGSCFCSKPLDLYPKVKLILKVLPSEDLY